jgi:hypothetical protein
MSKEIQLQKNIDFQNDKTRDLILSLVLDLIGMITFVIPGIGEFGDVIWAPISAYLMTKIYKGTAGKIAGIFSFLEEVLPFTDFIPSFTIMWFYTYVFKKENS